MSTLPPPGNKPFIATYLESPLADFRGNPLVEALPAIKDDDQWLEQLLTLPTFDDVQLSYDAYLRSYCVVELKDAFIPGERHRALARRIDQVIRWGYRKRNPLLPERAAALQRTYERAQSSGRADKVVYDDNKPICSYSLIGVSGMGKSTTMEAVLAAYPQYLMHPATGLFQIVWLKVECPKDGSIKELALNILRAFDRILGTSHAPQTSSNITTTFLMNKVNHLATAYCLGVLVLDELQNLSVKKSGGREEMLNWFQELVNELRLPVVLLGTFKARSILGLDVRHARRNGIAGSAAWRPMPLGAEFRFLLETLWSYQWLRNPGELTELVTQVIHEETQGVNAFVVDMFLIAQLYALRTGKETITPELFRHVARTEFEPLQPFLNAMRSKDPNRLKKFEDALSYDIEELIEVQQRLITHGAGDVNAKTTEVSLLARATASVRSTLGLPDAEARKLVEQVLDGSHKSIQALTKDALRTYFELTESTATAGNSASDRTN